MRLRTKILGSILLVVVVAISALAIALSHNSPCPSAALPQQAGANSMKAIVYRCYGSAEVAKVETVARPTPGANDVLIKVHGASINPLDWHRMRGEPYLMRLGSGFGAPHEARLGVDYAGTVEAVGANVTRFKPGDRVFGGADGTLADYVVARANGWIDLMPTNVSFEEAAAVPVAALTALQAVRDHGKVQPGQRIVVNGAAGGVGTFAVQIAKALGAEVTAVTSTGNLALVRKIGADHVIDYTQEDFTRGSQRYDVIVDCGGGHSLLDFKRALTPKGNYVVVGDANMGRWIGPVFTFLLAPAAMSRFTNQHFDFFVASPSGADLKTLRDLMQDGKVRPVIDGIYPLSRMPEAMAHLETGHARGKVVIAVE